MSTESDLNENGTFILTRLNTLISANMDNGTISDGSHDVSPPDDTANDRQGTLPQSEDHHGGSRDVSPLDDTNNGHQVTLSQHEDRGPHGAKERGQREKVVTQ